LSDRSPTNPETSLVVISGSFASEAIGLAGQSGRDDIHLATPREAIEGCKIVPNRRWLQGRFFHPRHQYGLRVGVPFTIAHSSVGNSELLKRESGSFFKHANPGT
jgi:hypothetical protein